MKTVMELESLDELMEAFNNVSLKGEDRKIPYIGSKAGVIIGTEYIGIYGNESFRLTALIKKEDFITRLASDNNIKISWEGVKND